MISLVYDVASSYIEVYKASGGLRMDSDHDTCRNDYWRQDGPSLLSEERLEYGIFIQLVFYGSCGKYVIAIGEFSYLDFQVGVRGEWWSS